MKLFEAIKRIFKAVPKEERRRSPRYQAEDVFFIEFKQPQDKEYEYASGRDISVHGVRFASSGKVKKGDVLQLRIIFPIKFEIAKRLEMKARVVRIYHPKSVRRNRIGCEFIHESDASEILLKRFCEWLATQPPVVKSSKYRDY